MKSEAFNTKYHNEMEITSQIPTDDLTKEKDYEDQKESTETQGCPYITSIDSGTEVSAISINLEDQLIKDHGVIPTFPLSGLQVHNAEGL
jgi:hypothetical protein